jgi:hypothetical protein
MNIKNKIELDKWMFTQYQNGHDIHSIKGAPKSWMKYEDDTPIEHPVNYMWVNSSTGEKFNIIYDKPQ